MERPPAPLDENNFSKESFEQYLAERDMAHRELYFRPWFLGAREIEVEHLNLWIDKWNSKEETQFDTVFMELREMEKVNLLKRLPFGIWLRDRTDAVPFLKRCVSILKSTQREHEYLLKKYQDHVKQEIHEGVYDDHNTSTLQQRMLYENIVPDIIKVVDRYTWYLKLAEGKIVPKDLNLEEVKHVPIATILIAPKQDTMFTTSNGRTFINCPLHTETTPSFCIYTKNNSWYCYGCGKGGDVINLYQLLHKKTFIEAVNELKKIS